MAFLATNLHRINETAPLERGKAKIWSELLNSKLQQIHEDKEKSRKATC